MYTNLNTKLLQINLILKKYFYLTEQLMIGLHQIMKL